MDLQGKTALITGANRGIGEATVEALFDKGVSKIYLAVRDPESTTHLHEKYEDKVETLQVDVTDKASVQKLSQKATDTQIVVNNAGIMKHESPLSENAEDALRSEFEVNVFGLLHVAQAFESTLVANKGAVVQLNSIASVKTFGDISTYCASKAATYSITQGLREKLSEKGVAVISIHPGPIGTDMGKNAGFDDAPGPEVVASAIAEALESEDFHTFPDDVAKQIGDAYASFADNIILGDMSL